MHITSDQPATAQPTSPSPFHPPTSRRQEVALNTIHGSAQLITCLEDEPDEEIALLRDSNDVQSLVMSLPNEVLSVIFEYSCPRRDVWEGSPRKDLFSLIPSAIHDEKQGDHSQLLISSVCSHWRQVARATTSLWAFIIFDLTLKNVRKNAEFLELYLSSTTDALLSVALRFSEDFELAKETMLTHPSADPRLFRNLPRIKALRLVRPTPAWVPQLREFPQLATCTLELDLHCEQSAFEFSPDAPLRLLDIDHSLWASHRNQTTLEAPWTKITHLRLTYVENVSAIKILLQCPNLVEFYAIGWGHQLSHNSVTLTSPISLHLLETFDMHATDCEWSRALTRYLNLPAVKQFTWKLSPTTSSSPDPAPYSQNFVSRLPSTVTTVDLRYSDFQCIPEDSSLQHLKLRYDNPDNVRSLFGRLGSRGIARAFPRLRELGLWPSPFSNPLPSDWSTLFLEMVEARLDCGTFLLKSWWPLDWLPDVQAKLKAIISEGFELKILEGIPETPVDWL